MKKEIEYAFPLNGLGDIPDQNGLELRDYFAIESLKIVPSIAKEL
jgi:hypothetical protein